MWTAAVLITGALVQKCGSTYSEDSQREYLLVDHHSTRYSGKGLGISIKMAQWNVNRSTSLERRM